MQRLSDNFVPKFNPALHGQLEDTTEIKSALEFGRKTSEVIKQIRESESNPDFNKIVEDLCAPVHAGSTTSKKQTNYPSNRMFTRTSTGIKPKP